jgi:hypothetical protein
MSEAHMATKKLIIEKAAQKLAKIALKNFSGMSEDEQERRISTAENKVATYSPCARRKSSLKRGAAPNRSVAQVR